MKRFLLLLVALAVLMPAAAQVRLGLKAGLTVNSLHLNNDLFDSDNQTGFTGGAVVDVKVPLLGLGFDLSAMYVRRNAKFMSENHIADYARDYIAIPLNLKWNFNLPVVGNLAVPYLATGPELSFLTSRRHAEGWSNKSCDWAWNFGVGVMLLNHLQIQASYGLGMTKAAKCLYDETQRIDGKNRYWTVTAGYFF